MHIVRKQHIKLPFTFYSPLIGSMRSRRAVVLLLDVRHPVSALSLLPPYERGSKERATTIGRHICSSEKENRMKRVLVLDFDGLICDGLDECILVTWNSHYEKDISLFSAQGLADIPKIFIERFRECRNFSKHLGHFLVPILDQTTALPTQDAFDAVYSGIPQAQIQEFMDKASAYRHLARSQKRDYWLTCHTLYVGFETFLRRQSLPTYIITAKDRNSVYEILSAKSIPFTLTHIFGEQRSKMQALAEIRQREQVEASQIHFIDDNVNNAYEAKGEGYQVSWASWGYHVPGHAEFAETQGIPIITLSDFLAHRCDLHHISHDGRQESVC
jgi:FMN phosphatase YigB (HAD superfamily)